MKKEWKKRLGSLLLCAALLCGSVSTDVCAAGIPGNGQEISMEEPETEKSGIRMEKGEVSAEKSEKDAISAEEAEKEEGTAAADEAGKDALSAGEAGKEGTVSGNEPERAESVIPVSGNDPADGQYHLIEEDPESVAKWLALYCPNGFEDLFKQDETWWDNLYDDERAYAEFLTGLIVELSEDVYDGQSASDCIRILESGADADAFFAGTIFQGMTADDLKMIHAADSSLEEVPEEEIEGILCRKEEPESDAETLPGEDGVSEKDAAACSEKDDVSDNNIRKAPVRKSRALSYAVKTDGETEKEETEGEEKEEEKKELMAKVQVTATGYRGTDHGRIYRISLGGVPAICVSFGKRCYSSFLYHAEPGTYRLKYGPLGYFAKNAGNSGAEYVACQIAAWLFMKNEDLSEINVRSRAQAMINISSEISRNRMLDYVWKHYAGAKSYNGPYYEYVSDNENAQVLITYREAAAQLHGAAGVINPDQPEGGAVSETVEIAYYIQVNKRDWQTGVGLAGCEVKIFENGAYLTNVTTDETGQAEYSVQKTASFSSDYDGVTVTEADAQAALEEQIADFAATPYTYSVSEVTAPVGYVWEANEKSETITGEETAVFDLTDERTLGAVELVKYDTESESGIRQGDAVLNGAVYGIYAAEDIYHQDKKTGILFRKDQLVQKAITGKTPKRNSDGYILNTDDSRHIAQPGKEIAYTDTPGKTLFGDLELGSYYIKEITPSEGYMFDEAVYPATFTYKDQMIKIEKRNESAGQADNELTPDDGSASDTVYSGDYVNKQAVQFLKTSDNAWQTELAPIEGAGFTVYLISELSGVRNGTVMPIGETWTADDIQTFYDYDFTDEKPATIYKRTGHEMWLESDKLWLKANPGYNEYRVGEMFTDRDGRIETPELPYGTYVIVETTTPEHHKSARPFIVSVTRDGGVLYTDEKKRTIEKAYSEEERIRYGDHQKTKEREGRVLQKRRIINNMITKTHLRLLKADEEFTVRPGAYISAEEFVRGTVLKEGAEYRLKCRTLSLSRDSLLSLNWKFDGDGYLSFYDQETRELVGTASRPFTTKFLRKDGMIEDCYVMLPQEIPIGTYELEELRAPSGYVVNGWEQFVQDGSSDRVNRYEIVDTPFPPVIFTIDNGAVYPDGQMGTNKYALADQYGNLTVTVLQENQEQKGIIEITKHGEQLAGLREGSETLLDKLDGEDFRNIMREPESAHRDLEFTYEDAPVEGAVFAIIAAEDIYTQEVDRELLDSYRIKKEQYLVHRKGDTVAAVTTDRNGWGYAADLYIGKYKIVETTAGDGFVLNTKETPFEITKKEQTVSFDIHTADYKNERQKLEIAVEKKDRETGKLLAGAIYGLYAKEDILINIEKAADGGKWIRKDTPETLCPADTLVATCITDQNGKGVFTADLPLGKYYVRELEAPAGYLTAADDISVNGSYDSIKGGQYTKTQVHCPVFRNRKTQAVISKQDLINREEIAGAALEIKKIETDEKGRLRKDAAGNYIAEVVDSWVSKKAERHLFYRDAWGYPVEIKEEEELPEGRELFVRNGHLVSGLEPEKAYILSEKEAPDGYGYAEDILFQLVQEKEGEKLTGMTGVYVMEDGIRQRCEEDLLVMYDEKDALEIGKSTINMTQKGDTYRYTVEKLKNLTGETLEQFTMTDHLPEGLYLTELWTGTYNESLHYDAEYMTNQSGEWILWESGLSTEENHHLRIPDALQKKENHIVKFRLCFGTVGGDFGKVESPAYMTCVSSDAEEVIINEIELTAEHDGKKLRDKDRTETVLYLKWLSGYRAEGGGSPLYEIVESPVPEPETKIRTVRSVARRRADARTGGQNGWTELEDEEVPLGIYRGGKVKTADDAPILFLAQTAATAFAGIVLLVFMEKKKKRKKSHREKYLMKSTGKRWQN